MEPVVDHGLAGGVLEAPVEPVDERLPHGGLREVDHRRHAAERGGARSRRERVGGHDGVRRERGIREMNVPVDRAGDHVEPARVELDCAVEVVADRRDALAGDSDVRHDRLLRRDDEAAPDHEVVAQGAVR